VAGAARHACQSPRRRAAVLSATGGYLLRPLAAAYCFLFWAAGMPLGREGKILSAAQFFIYFDRLTQDGFYGCSKENHRDARAFANQASGHGLPGRTAA